MKLVQVCRWASSYPPYKCILEYGKSIPINVYTIMKDNKKCSLFPFKLSCLMQKIISTVKYWIGERGGSVVECRTPEREVGGSKPTSAVLCP